MRLLLCLVLLASSSVLAENLVINDAWARATPPASSTAAVYLRLENTGEQTVVVRGVSSAVAGGAMIHHTMMMDGMMKMHHMEDLRIEPGSVVVFKPQGLHIMLTQLKEPLSEGSRFNVLFKVARESAGQLVDVRTKEVQVAVGPIDQMQAKEDE